MALKSFILSKLDHQMSKSWKQIAAHELGTTSKFDLLKNWVPDCSAQGRNLTKLLDSKHVLKLYFNPSRKKIFCIFTTSYFSCPAENPPLKMLLMMSPISRAATLWLISAATMQWGESNVMGLNFYHANTYACRSLSWITIYVTIFAKRNVSSG